MEQEPIIKIEGLRLVYDKGKPNETLALKDINLQISPEEYIVFFGPSGSGKSSLLYIIAGMEVATQGHVFVSGKDITKFNQHELAIFHQSTIGMVFQAYNLVPTLSVLANVILPSMLRSGNRSQRAERANMLLNKFGLGPYLERLPNELSGGQQQRVAIVRALMNNPPIILADEPVGNLDTQSAKIVMDILKDLNDNEKRTVILVTHEPSYLQFAHRVYYIRDGSIEREGVNKESLNMDLTQKSSAPSTQSQIMPVELENLVRKHPGATLDQLKAKAITGFLTSPYSVETVGRIEKAVTERLTGKLTAAAFLDALERPQEKDGVGLDKEVANKLLKQLEELVVVSEVIGRKQSNSTQENQKYLSADEIQLDATMRYLLEDVSNPLSENQKNRLKDITSRRLQDKMTSLTYEEELKKPLQDGGVGLDESVVERVARKMEAILLRITPS
ncbi:MAG: ABC transporter ATP-binding protein [Candidatus Spechtbacteria bacterium]|nr:ABC transporter ATP-binding protein [Candidatus Spechtbacteria bacterium]